MAPRWASAYREPMRTSPIFRTLVILLFAGAAVVRVSPEGQAMPMHLVILEAMAIAGIALLFQHFRGRPHA